MTIKVKIDDLEFDATPEQDYQGDVETTDHPVEDAFNPTDHARSKPETWSGTCIVSSVPADDNQKQARGGYKSGGSGGYARQTFEQVRAMKDDHKTHTLTTPLRTYFNMVITSLSSPSRANMGDAVQFKISLKQILIVSSQSGQFLTKPKAPKTQKPTDKVNQAKKQGKRKSTVLGSVFGSGTGAGVQAP